MIKNLLEWSCILWTVCTIIWFVLSFFNIMPFYQVKMYKVNSISPIINLFPASKIRLNFDFNKAASKEDISTSQWSLLKDNKMLYQIRGLEPTITLPPTEGGIYQLQIIATTKDDQVYKGKMNFYVVQDTPKKVKCSSSMKLDLTTENNSLEFLKETQTKGIEVFGGNSQWTKVETSPSNNKVTVNLKPNETISTYNDQIPIRIQGSSNELSSYASVPIPQECKTPNPLKLNPPEINN